MRCLHNKERVNAIKLWPEPMLLEEPANSCEVDALIHLILQDEADVNGALEFCRVDYSHMPQFEELKYRCSIEGTPALEEFYADASDKTTLRWFS